MWYESSDFFINMTILGIIYGIIINCWIKTYTVNKYQKRSLFNLEVKEKEK